ncbi:MAG: PD-(D/E)XK nuclease family protein [Pseudomonadales bacterium]|nr:PD-(D/E)XK nuclease family protein [Pseudomonadales bacterium]
MNHTHLKSQYLNGLIRFDRRLSDLCEHSLVLTPNNRLAEVLKQDYVRFQIDQERSAWPTPEIRSYSDHLLSQFAQLQRFTNSSLHLLDKVQQHLAWLGCAPDLISDKHSLSKLAEDSWHIIHEWDIDLSSRMFVLNDTTEIFQSWAYAFQNHIKENHWITQSEIPELIIQSLPQDIRLAPSQILLFGFEIESTKQSHLFSTYQKFGSTIVKESIKAKITDIPAAETQLPPNILVLDSAEDELRHVAEWARKQINTPSERIPSIGIIVPGLEVEHARVVRHFENVFSPSTAGGDPMLRSFNISGGIALTRTTVCGDALALLSWLNKALKPAEIYTLSSSPYLDIHGLSKLKNLRNLPLSLPYMERVSESETLHKIVQLDAIAQKQKKPLSFWATSFKQILKIANWPKIDALQSVHFQAAEQLMLILDEMEKSIDVVGKCALNEAVNYFRSIVREKKFSPQSSSVPIQIMTALESDGLSFDHMWLMGFNNREWPANPSPTPFIPMQLMKENGVPRITLQSELDFSERFINNLIARSRHSYFSYARFSGDEEIEMSRLLTHHAEPVSMDLYAEQLVEQHIKPPNDYFHPLAKSNDVQLEYYSDSQAPELDPASVSRGGAGLLTDQSNCPFRAFANHRLNADTKTQAGAFPDAGERGSIIHSILEDFFSRVRGQSELEQMSPENRSKSLASIITANVARTYQYYPEPFQRREISRLQELAEQWLLVELQRPPFYVLKTEQVLDCHIEGLNLKTRIDRIDIDIETNDQIVIDYKTGTVNLYDWSGERPSQPQLPLYATQTNNTTTLLYAQVKKDECKITGLSGIYASGKTADIRIGKLEDMGTQSWRTLTENWMQSINKLAKEFQSGYAEVKPTALSSCEYCELQSLCRVQTQKVNALDEQIENSP